MPSLSREHRRMLENTVVQARTIAEDGARRVLTDQYAVHHHEPWQHMTPEDRELRNQLRAHGRQLGDQRDPRTGTQDTFHLVQACAYEHWHRMLFARFLAENDLLLDLEHGVAMSLEEVRELAREQGREWMEIAAEMAQRMLLAVFRPDDPVLRVQLPPETQQQLEEKLSALPNDIFGADDSLGWVYQFWQRDEKERVNRSEVKIGADELPPVTQLFTEDYMVLFLLENTLGAWWTAKRIAEGKATALPGYQWTYLRLSEEGSPAAGSFDAWPRTAKELKVLDPCMGSGHFLVFALPILTRMRMEEEGDSLQGALAAVLRENLFGLEIDPRCSQIAAFNLALASWRLAGEHFTLPDLQIACSGMGPNCTKEQWMKLAEEVAARGGMPARESLFGSDDSLLSEPARNAMGALYDLFSQAPVLGSLIDPGKLRGHLFEANYQAVAALFSDLLGALSGDETTRERLIAAAGMVRAAALLAGKYTLVVTNVPFLGMNRQAEGLFTYLQEHYPASKADLATAFIQRCLLFCSTGTSISVVAPQIWLFLGSYKHVRRTILESDEWNFVARLGPGAFESVSGEVVNVGLFVITRSLSQATHRFAGTDASGHTKPSEKAQFLREGDLVNQLQSDQLRNPDARVTLESRSDAPLLSKYADSYWGIGSGDIPRFAAQFWELASITRNWRPLHVTSPITAPFTGREEIIDWRKSRLDLCESDHERELWLANRWTRGSEAWGQRGVAISQMAGLRATLFSGEIYQNGVAAIIPKDPTNLPALWAFCSSDQFAQEVRKIDKKLSVTNLTLIKVPFDLAHWQSMASERYPDGLPMPFSDDPSQWLFNGHPKGSEYPLQVGIARLVNYRWPRQTGSSFPDCPALSSDGLETHTDADGIVPLAAIAGEASAGDRLRGLLAGAYGAEWSASKIKELLGDWHSLEDWMRDGFFEEHCRIFHHRPFVWHVWDGRKDGFHAFVNYHKLAALNGEGRQTLEKLIYTYLGRWIERQNDEVREGKEGADGRLTAAVHLKAELEKILKGEKPYDIFIRWKPIHEQPLGWDPDVNDGVRLNIRPWLTATLAPSTKPKKGACILRVTPKINLGKDRGKEPHHPKEEFPWFWTWDEATDDFEGGKEFDGARWNDLHYSIKEKRNARTRKAMTEATTNV